MYSEELYQKLKHWSESTLLLLRDFLPLASPISQHSGWSPEQRQTLRDLLVATARSSESALLLTAYAQLWDAEVLVRSILEGSLKFTYILQSENTFTRRHDEYRHDLFQIALLKDHAKALDLLNVIPNSDQPAWRPIRDRLLSANEYADISNKYPAKQRRSLDTRWGFTGIIGEFARSDDPLLQNFSGFANGYSMASHVLHADHVGTSVPSEIDQRTPDRKESMLLAHGSRLMSDVLSCFQIRLWIGYRFIGHPLGALVNAKRTMDYLMASFGTAYDDWMKIEYP